VFRANPPKTYKSGGLSYYEISASFGYKPCPCLHYLYPCGSNGTPYDYTKHELLTKQGKAGDYWTSGEGVSDVGRAYIDQDKKFWLCMTTQVYPSGFKDPNTGTDLYATNPVPGTVLCDITMDIRAS
jgi:hypothetical protein